MPPFRPRLRFLTAHLVCAVLFAMGPSVACNLEPGGQHGEGASNNGNVAETAQSSDNNRITESPSVATGKVMVLTQRNDSQRTGGQLLESVLNTTNVASGQFQKLYTLPVDGDVYAQPLYVGSLQLNGGNHNVLVVATAHNSVYAFDADAGTNTTPLWQVNLGASIPMMDFPGETNFQTEMGITGTPVIDLASHSVYLVTALKTSAAGDPNPTYAHKLHRLNLLTGAEMPNSPVAIDATAPGSGFGSVNGMVSMVHNKNLQRTGLLLANQSVYFGFSCHGLNHNYHGWFLSYDAYTLTQRGVFVSSPNSAASGIWQGGQGPSVDANGHVFVTTSNSVGGDATQERIESLVKFEQLAQSMNVIDYFTTSEWATRDANDEDFGSSGAMLVSDMKMAVNGDKAGNLYFSNTSNLGGLGPDNSALYQQLSMGPNTAFFGAPVYYHGPAGARIYAWSQNDVLKAYDVGSLPLSGASIDQAPDVGPIYMPGGILSVSANGNEAGTGIVWATVGIGGTASGVVRSGILYAFDAADLSRLLFSSQTNASRDAVGKFAKFTPPTIANGKVYLGTFSNQVAVYGLASP